MTVMNLSKFSSTILLSLFLSLTNFSFGGLSVRFFLSPVQGQTIEEKQVEAKRLLQRGIQQAKANQFQEAILSFQQSLKIYREIGNLQGEVNSLNNLGRFTIH